MQHLRPIERRVLAMQDDGLGVEEIAGRLKRSPGHVERIISWTGIPRSGLPPRRSPRAMQRRVIAMRAEGESHERIAERFQRSPGFIRRVEGHAYYARARQLLGGPSGG